MTIAAPTFNQIHTQVKLIRQKSKHARTIALHALGRWTGERVQKKDGTVYCIEQCDSPLELRQALKTPVEDGTVKVILTPLQDADLSSDIRLRIAKRRLLPIDRWQIVKSFFNARELDPRLLSVGQLADLLLDLGEDDYPAASGGFLTAELVWGIVLDRYLGLDQSQPDLFTLLDWASQPDTSTKCRNLPAEFQQAVADWLANTAGGAAGSILQQLARKDGPDVLALGLVLAVIFHADAKSKLPEGLMSQRERALGRLEARYFDDATPAEAHLQQWADAALELVTQSTSSLLPDRVDNLLADIGAQDLAYLSTVSILGRDQRLSCLAKELTQHLNDPEAASAESLATAHQNVLEHLSIDRDSEGASEIEMALRLLRWLTAHRANPPESPRSLDEAISREITTGCFVDWARLTLRRAGTHRDLEAAFAELVRVATEVREEDAQHFARLLRDAMEVDAESTVTPPIEKVLAERVAPLAANKPVLVLVMDGMGLAACRELLADLVRQRWVLIQPVEQDTAIDTGLAVVPSVTEVSRCSLFCGQLKKGNASIEQKGFAKHPALLAKSKKAFPPILFHKADLHGRGQEALSIEVREALASPEQQVVGIVVNVMDDQLSVGDQLQVRWTQRAIAGFESILEESRSADRCVVLLSDHGCVIENQTRYQAATQKGGARWRFADDSLTKGEIEIAGSRVFTGQEASSARGTTKVIAPWTEKLRYGPKKHGYHGGVSPQEMLIPVAVLSPTESSPKGWQEAPVDIPHWWEMPIANDRLTAPSVSELPEADWIERLFDSPQLVAQLPANKALASSEKAAMKTVLTFLAANSNRATLNAIARELHQSTRQAQTLLKRLQALINIDGYQIMQLNVEDREIILHMQLLAEQFELTLNTSCI